VCQKHFKLVKLRLTEQMSEATKWKRLVTPSCDPSYSGGIGRRIRVRGWPRHKVRSYMKNKESKKGWVVAQVVEPLPSARSQVQASVPPERKAFTLASF
jgi:hypothetical protein